MMRSLAPFTTRLPLLALAALSCGLGWRNLSAALPAGSPISSLFFPDRANTGEMLAYYTMLPRIAVAVMAGAALGLAGAILQRILRNNLAEPATLGISAGSHVAMAAVAVLWPGLSLVGREWIALAGAGAALLTILALSWHRNLSPVTVILSGLIVSLYCGAAAAVLTLFNHDLLIGLFLWGAGYLDQQDWSGVCFLAPRLLAGLVVAALLVRPLTLLTLQDDSARGLGISPVAIRLIALTLAGALTAIVTAAVGVISFVGLAAPALSRLSAARTTGRYLFEAAVIGALLLTATDQIVQSLPTTYRLFPTGAVTAMLGAPLLLIMIPRLRSTSPPAQAKNLIRSRVKTPWATLAILTVVAALFVWIAIAFGRGPNGWEFATGKHLWDLLDWRLPRVIAAFSGGAMLALAGAILQRMTGNPLASPEVLGVSSGAMLGVIALMLSVAAPSRGMQITAGAFGAFGVLSIMLSLSQRRSYGGEQLLLVGIALGSVSGFVMAVLMAAQDPRLSQLLTWLSGSTYQVSLPEAATATATLAAGLIAIPFIRRWLELFALGTPTAAAIGVPLILARGILFCVAATVTAGATILIGPLSFCGLMGPHLARLAGFNRAATQMIAASILGGLVLLVADWLGRNIIFPFQIPAGLLATMIGGPFLLYLIGKRS